MAQSFRGQGRSGDKKGKSDVRKSTGPNGEKNFENMQRNNSKVASRFKRSIECVGEIPRGQASRQLPSVWQRKAPVSPAMAFRRSSRALSRGSTIRFNARCIAPWGRDNADSASPACRPSNTNRSQCIAADDRALSIPRCRAGGGRKNHFDPGHHAG